MHTGATDVHKQTYCAYAMLTISLARCQQLFHCTARHRCKVFNDKWHGLRHNPLPLCHTLLCLSLCLSLSLSVWAGADWPSKNCNETWKTRNVTEEDATQHRAAQYTHARDAGGQSARTIVTQRERETVLATCINCLRRATAEIDLHATVL